MAQERLPTVLDSKQTGSRNAIDSHLHRERFGRRGADWDLEDQSLKPKFFKRGLSGWSAPAA
jgi:hypothetical protein